MKTLRLNRYSAHLAAIVGVLTAFGSMGCVEPSLINSSNPLAVSATTACSLRDTFRLIGGVVGGGGLATDKAYSSSNGTTWSEVGTLPAQLSGGSVVVSGDGQFAYIGGVNTAGVVQSVITVGPLDASSWANSAYSLPDERAYFAMVYFQGKYYMYGGYDQAQNPQDNIYSSTDGLNWVTEATPLPAAMAGHDAVVFNNTVYIYGGADNAWAMQDWIYESADGINFVATGTTLPAPWTGGIPTAITYNSKLYIIGGIDSGWQATGSIWSSTDGENWAVEAGTLPEERAGHATIISDGKIWVLGGYDRATGARESTIWTTTDLAAFTSLGNLPVALFNTAVPVVPNCQ